MEGQQARLGAPKAVWTAYPAGGHWVAQPPAEFRLWVAPTAPGGPCCLLPTPAISGAPGALGVGNEGKRAPFESLGMGEAAALRLWGPARFRVFYRETQVGASGCWGVGKGRVWGGEEGRRMSDRLFPQGGLLWSRMCWKI